MGLYQQIKVKFLGHFLTKKFFLFVLVGCINTFNSTAISFLFSHVFNPNLSFVFGYLISLVIGYVLNSLIAFKEKLSFRKLLKFCISYIPNFIIQNLMVLLIHNLLGFHRLIAYLAAAVIGLPVTFLILKLFTFGKQKQQQKQQLGE